MIYSLGTIVNFELRGRTIQAIVAGTGSGALQLSSGTVVELPVDPSIPFGWPRGATDARVDEKYISTLSNKYYWFDDEELHRAPSLQKEELGSYVTSDQKAPGAVKIGNTYVFPEE